MALRSPLSALRRLSRTLATQPCAPAAPPPCPACAPAPRPPCRAPPPPPRARAVRRLCRPPPQGRAPPCPPCAPAPPLTCSGASKGKKRIVPVESINCGADRDSVALRLALAERTRRLEYEQEVRARAARRPRPPPPAGFRPPAESPHHCAIRDGDYVDPCAHVPRTITEIDRGASARPANSVVNKLPKTVSLCSRRPCDVKCQSEGAPRAGDTAWCKTLRLPPAAAPACREPTTMEKLKRRASTGWLRTSGTSGRRSFHSCTTICLAPDNRQKKLNPESSQPNTDKDAELLKKVLDDREKLHKAGQGRVVSRGGKKVKKPLNVHGSMEIPVPPGVDNVRVRVSLDGEGARHAASSSVRDDSMHCSGKPSSDAGTKREPWLSLKSLQKKIANCKSMAKSPKDPKKDGPVTDPQSPCRSPGPPASEKPSNPSPCTLQQRPLPCPPPKLPAQPSHHLPPKQPSQPSPCAPRKQQKPLKKSEQSPCKTRHKPQDLPRKPSKKSENTPCAPTKKPTRFSSFYAPAVQTASGFVIK